MVLRRSQAEHQLHTARRDAFVRARQSQLRFYLGLVDSLVSYEPHERIELEQSHQAETQAEVNLMELTLAGIDGQVQLLKATLEQLSPEGLVLPVPGRIGGGG